MECVTKYKRIMNIFQKLSKEKRYEELSQLEKIIIEIRSIIFKDDNIKGN